MRRETQKGHRLIYPGQRQLGANCPIRKALAGLSGFRARKAKGNSVCGQCEFGLCAHGKAGGEKN